MSKPVPTWRQWDPIERKFKVWDLMVNPTNVYCESTDYFSESGQRVFDEDIVAAKDRPREGEPESTEGVIVDRVHWEDGAWRLGTFDGTLDDFVIIRVEGNTFEKIWPLNQ